MIDRVSLQLGDVLEGVKDKSIEQKYGYLQAAYCDLGDYYEAQLARKDALLKAALKVVREIHFAMGDYHEILVILGSPEVKAIMEGK